MHFSILLDLLDRERPEMNDLKETNFGRKDKTVGIVKLTVCFSLLNEGQLNSFFQKALEIQCVPQRGFGSSARAAHRDTIYIIHYLYIPLYKNNFSKVF